ncbi:PKD domain-containing protein [Chitinophagales bacterium]|nr:PKD domain-containing protein [Chitinophagales bacterium]
MPVTLTVVGIPDLQVIAQDDFDFGSILIGLNNTAEITISNPGTDNLMITDITSTDGQYTTDQSSYDIPPGGEVTITVTFTPNEIGDYPATITLVNNDEDLVLEVNGSGQGAPSVAVSPNSLTMTLLSGETETVEFVLNNSGQGPLIYDASVAGAGTGFNFNFDTNSWANEFSWELVDSDGNVIQDAETGAYANFANHNEILNGLDGSQDYTLNFEVFNNFGALENYVINDLVTGEETATGTFTTGNTQEVFLGSPTPAFAVTISPSEGEVGFPSESTVGITVDATGALAGVYDLILILETNDPTNPIIEVPFTLSVIAFPQSQFEADNDPVVCGTAPIQFTDQSVNVPTEWLWDFGDETTSTEQNPIHSYNESGNFTVTLTATNDVGTDVSEIEIVVDIECATVSVPNTGTATIEACNGELFDSGGPNNSYAFNANGVMILAPPSAASVTLSFVAFDYEPGFDTLFVYDGASVMAPLIGSFTGTDLPNGGEIISTNGALTLRETSDQFVSNSGFEAFFACSAPEAAPVANGVAVQQSTCGGDMQFEDMSTNFPNQWSWDFGDDGTSQEANPIHTYAESGTYTVTLSCSNDWGSHQTTFDVDAFVLTPVVEIPDTAYNGMQTFFGGLTPDGSTHSWAFGDGGISQFPSPPYTYNITEDVTYTVTVTVANPGLGADCQVVVMEDILILLELPDGILEVFEENVVNVFPNPVATDKLTIEYQFDGQQNFVVEIIDQAGKSIIREEQSAANGFSQTYNMAGLASGYYLVRVHNGTAQHTEKILIQR